MFSLRRRQLRIKSGLVMCSLLALAGCTAYPNVSLSGEPRPAIEISAVSVAPDTPPHAIYMGQVFAWSPLPVDSAKGYANALAKLKERAASVGANVVVVPTLTALQMQAQLRHRFLWPLDHGFARDRDHFDDRPDEMMGLIYLQNNSQ